MNSSAPRPVRPRSIYKTRLQQMWDYEGGRGEDARELQRGERGREDPRTLQEGGAAGEGGEGKARQGTEARDADYTGTEGALE
ncbi:hypothetical protein E2C01_065440 [Portunus trituberculatus]|uniref:Uncharacterized protein n=1 Tax=Portunus trituberculatus TaxID=210409 RepID=A0A5B7HFL9_PORTR|nr:hypothetical protein [Portunus trituberculatus]